MSDAPPPTVSLGDLHLPRILCLHGGGVNAEAFRLQCRGLFRSLNGTFRLVFPDAPYLSPADPGVMPTYAHLQPFRRWLRWEIEQANPGPEAICGDIDRALHEAMISDDAMGATGGWAAIMGFSQGAKLAASLLLRQQLRAEKIGKDQAGSDFKFAILLAGRAPLVALDADLSDSLALADADELTTGAFAQVTGSFLQGSDHVLRLPTLHVHGKKDPGLANHRRLLTDFCKAGTTRLVEWDGDHRVVIQAADVAAVTNEILALSKQTGVISLQIFLITTSAMELFLCGPQASLPSPKDLGQLRQILLGQKSLYASLTLTLNDLPNLLRQLTTFDVNLKRAPSAASIDCLLQWLDSGHLSLPVDDLPNIASLPFAVILQVALFLQHLAKNNTGSDYGQTVQALQQYGVQGFCTGFLTAAAIDFSRNEEQLAEYTATSLRLAMCIGVYIDQNALYAEPPNPVCALSVRWKEGQFSKRQVEDLLAGYAHAYIACITDVSCVTVTAQASDEKQLTEVLREAGLRAKKISINGRFHSAADHITAAQTLRKFTKSVKGLQYPEAFQLQAPLRRNDTGELITGGDSVTDIALHGILLHTADWYTTVRKTFDAFPTDHPRVTTFAFEGVVPLSLSQRNETNDHVNITNGANGVNRVNGINENLEANYPPHSVAVVGMSCRFPGADDVDKFWDLLESGVSMVREVPLDRLNLNNHRLADYAKTKFWGNFIDDPESFDHRFFRKSAREAVSWDPEKRILLEVVYEALESAGHFGPAAANHPNDYGCYIGAVGNNYYDNVACHPPNAYSMLGTSRAFFSGRISHQFGFTGPAMTIDTACSSSLVAINAACRAIQSGECSRAVAGGTNVFTSPFDYQNLAAAGFLSSTGACKPFDASADGYCRGEGVAAVVLKPLSAAIKEGDHVLGVIVGSAVNQNHNDAHITVPCSSSQTAVYNKVLGIANSSSSSVTYVEAHGTGFTGTQVGDPIECQSIRDAFGGSHRKEMLHFGSVKGHIGHTEASAGVAGLIKILLMMQHNTILGQASYSNLNPKIPALEPDMMAIPRKSQPWKTSSKFACINSYGAAGSNAVVAIREAMPVSSTTFAKRPTTTTKQPFFMSASSEASLVTYARKLLAYVEVQRTSSENTSHLLSDILFNLTDRSNHKLAYSVSKTLIYLKDLEEMLSSIVTGSETPIKDAGSGPRPVVLVFGGQEKDFVGLSKEAVDNSALFRSHLDTCDFELQSLGHGSLYPAIYQRESIQNLPTLHAVLFAVQYASAKAWIDSGLRVSSIVGHSFGQLTALCISGCLSTQDALKLVVGRAELINVSWGEERGSMISVQSDHAVVNSILDTINTESPDSKLEIACFNHPTNHVVVGTTKAVDIFESHIAADNKLQQNIRVKRLNVTHGFHSALTEGILPGLESLANSVQWNKPTISIELATEEHIAQELGAWLIPHHIRNPVYFSSAVQRLAQKFPSCVWVEAGQGSSVMSLVKNSVKGEGQPLYCPSFLNGPNAISSVAETVVELWKTGIHVQFWPYHRSERSHFEYKSLPPYQFEKTKHWLPFINQAAPEPAPTVAPATQTIITHEFISFLEFSDSSKKEAVFLVDPESERYMYLLNGHIASNQALAPASLYVELLSRAAMILTSNASFDTHVINMNSMQMKGAPIGLDSKKNIYIKLTRITPDVDYWGFEFSSKLKEGGEVQIHVIGKVGLGKRDDPALADTIMQWSALIGYKKCLSIMNNEDGEKMQGRHIYQALQKLIFFDEMYHGIKSISYQGHEAAGKVAATLDPKLSPKEALYDTPTIDGMMQFAGVLVNYFAHPSGKDVLLCQGINRIVTGGAFDITAGEWIAYSLLTEDTDERTVSDVYIFDKKSQQVVIAFIGFVFTRTSVSVLQRSLRSVNSGGSGANPTPAPAGVAPIPVAVTGVSAEPSKASKVLEVFHNVTDIPMDEIALGSTLEELGVDSLLVTEVLNEIQTAFGLDIELNTFLFFPNVKAVCDYIDSALGLGIQAEPPALAEAKVKDVAVRSLPTKSLDVDSRPSLQHAQKVFADCKDAYERAAVETKAVEFWEKCYPRQAALVLAYVVEAFAKLGCNMASIKAGNAAPMIPHLTNHKQLVRQLYRVLEDAGLIIVNDQGQFVRTTNLVDPTPAATIFKQIIPEFPLHASVHRIVQVVGSELAECLTGEKDGLQIVFGNKENKKTLDDLYENWPLVRSGTIALGEFLEKAMANPDKPGVFRILEVGAGTGGTTKYIARHLQKLGIPFEYVFTDLSPSLVAAAKRTFKDCPEMEFATLDIEKDPPASWIGSFHFIISTNCVHATRNLTTSLTSLRKLLRKDGVLTLVEITRNMFWLDIAVGLFEGWWLFEDGREHAVTPEWLWKEHMLRAGFNAVDWTDGEEPEARTIRVIAGFPTSSST
ncbi:Methylphloroacetophenone synthase [Lachnellula hyalina]|uniref:Methylphloroacetophenone synthase n=1 Tax=Lachnellula hyalina TaxID=1316788 RepID=A0A8H8R8Q9_9HELO|nr:Methylphloroacetophenone synthase [Lachnellula hyalina]TVY29662.1 Methylphloroacetophenone synthase [Lachnellula hyalina]